MRGLMPAFGGPVSFLGSRTLEPAGAFDGVFGVLGFPSDSGSTWAPGTRFGPRSLREVSLRFARVDAEGRAGFWDLGTGRRVLDDTIASGGFVDCGDVCVLPNDLEGTYADAAERVGAIVAGGGIPVVLGGDHAITYPVAGAVPGPFTMIQIDAHLDYSPYEGSYRNSHAHPFRQVTELSHIERVLQVGIRSYRTLETDARDSLDAGNVIVQGRTILEEGAEALVPHLVEGAPVYVSFDVDVLDSYLVPGVSAAEPGGLSAAQASDLLRSIAARCDIVAVDICEVNPMLDLPSRPTAFIAAQLLVDLMGAIETARVTGRGAGTTGGKR